MSVPIVISVIGGIALLIGIFGGGIKAKEVEIPSVNVKIRIISAITGVFLITIAAFLSSPDLLNPHTQPSVLPTDIQPTQSFSLLSQHLSSSDYGDLLYEDNFNKDTGDWSLNKGSQIQNGMLILAYQSETHPSWYKNYSDFIFETEFRFIDPPSSGWAALSAYLRYMNPNSNCPGTTANCSDQIAVSSKGTVAVWRPNGTDNYEQLLADTQATDFSSNGDNKLTVIMNGSEYRIFINDVFVRSFSDSTYTSGIVVLTADNTSVVLNYVRIYAIP